MASVSVSSRRNQLLEWFPFYVHRLVGDVRYTALKDYQQAWYLNLLFAAIVQPTVSQFSMQFPNTFLRVHRSMQTMIRSHF
jgi:hypothetical protein